MVGDHLQRAYFSLLALDQVLRRCCCKQLLSAISNCVFASAIKFALPRPEPSFGFVLADFAEPGEDAFAFELLVDCALAGAVTEDA